MITSSGGLRLVLQVLHPSRAVDTLTVYCRSGPGTRTPGLQQPDVLSIFHPVDVLSNRPIAFRSSPGVAGATNSRPCAAHGIYTPTSQQQSATCHHADHLVASGAIRWLPSPIREDPSLCVPNQTPFSASLVTATTAVCQRPARHVASARHRLLPTEAVVPCAGAVELADSHVPMPSADGGAACSVLQPVDGFDRAASRRRLSR